MDGGVMVAALAAASGALVGAFVAIGAIRWKRARSTRRLEPVQARVDEHVAAIGETLDRVAARLAQAATGDRGDLEFELDLDALLDQVVARAAASTGAQAVAIRVQGPGGDPVVASFGATDGVGLLENALGPPDERPFRALTINWTYGPGSEDAGDRYSSALVVPVVESGTTTGALVAYAGPSGAFESKHLRALRELVDEAAPRIAGARRFSELDRRSLTDPLTGARNRSGYELELEREVARAERTGRPLSLLVLSLEGGPAEDDAPPEGERGSDERALQELAALLARTVRTTDITCRRRDRQLAVVLPETRDEGAQRLWARLHSETRTASFSDTGPTVSVGLVEWRPNETSGALDARAVAAVGRTSAAELESAGVAVAAAVGFGRERRTTREAGPRPDLESRLRERLTEAIAVARAQGQELAVAAVEVGDLGPVAQELGGEVADALRAHVAARIEDCLDEGSVVSRLDEDRYAIVLPRATAADAESTLAVLQAALEVRPRGLEAGSVTVSAGIAELTAADDAAALLERAGSALRRAHADGSSAVVVARPGS